MWSIIISRATIFFTKRQMTLFYVVSYLWENSREPTDGDTKKKITDEKIGTQSLNARQYSINATTGERRDKLSRSQAFPLIV